MMILFRNIMITCLLTMAVSSQAQQATFTTTEQVQIRKSFYLLYVLERKSDVHNTLLKDAAFARIAASRQERLAKANSQCKDAYCIADALLWTPDEIREAGTELQRLAVADKSF